MSKYFTNRLLNCIICILIIVTVSLILGHTNAISENKEIFPVPDNLKPNVEFWIKVFSKYHSDQVIIHDAVHLDVIYEVVDTKKIFGSRSVSSKVKWREIEKIKDKYRAILKKFARYSKVDPNLLNSKEIAVYNLFKSKKMSSNLFKSASRNIRGQQGLLDHFKKGLKRSGRYADKMTEIFSRHNLPLELMALPHVESSFNHKAYSKFGAAGMWQFTRGTGREYLKINYTVDERFDPIYATEAAAKLLKNNYRILESWPLALTAYNHGVNGMKRAVRQLGTKDIGKIVEKYKSRNFKFASRNFYAEFIAAYKVRNNYKQYFGNLQFEEPAKYITFKVPNYIRLSILSKRLNISQNEIKELNPSLRKSVLKSKRRLPKGFALKLPWNDNFDPTVAFAQIPAAEKFENQVATSWYQVERGDNLQAIARRHRTSITNIMDLNDINNPNQIYIGQVLRLKAEEIEVAQQTTAPKSDIVKPVLAKKETKMKVEPVVASRTQPKSGLGDRVIPEPKPEKIEETLVINKPKEKIKQKENIYATVTKPDNIKSNQGLTPPKRTRDLKPKNGVIYVQPEETLGHFADWLGIPTQQLRRANKLRYGQDIHLGQKIKLLYKNIAEKEFQRKRMEYHRGIEEDFFASFKIDSIINHKVKRGENIWYLCNQVYEIPYWLVMKYNPNVNLGRLNTNNELVIPVIEPHENNVSS